MSCPRCQQENPSHAKFCLACGVPFSGKDGPPAGSYTDLRRALGEALGQQEATSEILRVISSSPTNLEPVAQAIADSAARLCDSTFTAVFRFDGEQIQWVAARGTSREQEGALRDAWPRPPGRESLVGRTILARETIHIHDASSDPTYTAPALRPRDPQARVALAIRSFLGVPMLRDGQPIGVIGVVRSTVRPFSEQEIALIQTFADQAVIAIENVRLFRELEEKNRALTDAHATVSESLERQTATSEILRVISSSPAEVQPVFDAIASSATRLCDGLYGLVFRFDGEMITLVAEYGSSPERLEVIRSAYPAPPGRGSVAAQAILERRVIAIADAQSGTEYPHIAGRAKAIGYRSILSVPMLCGDAAIGAINVVRLEPIGFTDTQVELLKTFADQAVIAIENVRLFTELQEKNRAVTAAHAEVTETLEQQTAMAEILRVISTSPTHLQPVLAAVVQSAARFCGAPDASIFRLDGGDLRADAHHGTVPQPAGFLVPVVRGTVAGRSVIERQPVSVTDLQVEAEEFPEGSSLARQTGQRATLSAPLLREGVPIGVILLRRAEAVPFADKQIALLQTFADQAVIAIENVRLFTELQARNRELTDALDQQTATSEILKVISGSQTDVQPVFDAIVRSAVRLCNGLFSALNQFDGELMHLVAQHNYTTEALQAVRRVYPARPTPTLLNGRAILERAVIHIPDVEADPVYQHLGLTRTIGFRSGLFVPMLREGEPIGVISVGRAAPGAFSANEIELLKTFADQAVIAIANVRLFQELEVANRELQAASQHKSEFLANMSHELRTPLNAIIGFSEVLSERMFGELNEKQDEYLKDIHASGQHLLSLINDILDLSKIEAGRMELELTDFHVPTALDNALTLVRERAGRRGIALHMAIDERLGYVRADERKVRQAVLNLLSNAIKFTSEGGRIEVRAKPVDGSVEVSVTDTGVGIAPEDQEAIFEEFRQVGTAEKKVEGTGLGLALSRKFIELHGGKIWVESQVGVGSTFTFTIPTRTGA